MHTFHIGHRQSSQAELITGYSGISKQKGWPKTKVSIVPTQKMKINQYLIHFWSNAMVLNAEKCLIWNTRAYGAIALHSCLLLEESIMDKQMK